MRLLKRNINTKSYWDELLKSGYWGNERGELHNHLAKFIPKNKKITILDMGCAIGHGTIILSKKHPLTKIGGCDFSSKGIKQAKNKYGKKIRFFLHDIRKDKLPKKYDYILLIETLEHLTAPKKAVRKYLKNCSNFIATVPYKEKGWKEHVHYFDENFFNNIKGFRTYKIFNKPKTNQKIIAYFFKLN